MIQCAASISMPDGLGNPRKSDGGVRVTQCTEHRTHPGQRRPPSGGLQPAQGRKLALTSPYLYVHTYLPGYTAPSQFRGPQAVPRLPTWHPSASPCLAPAFPRPSPCPALPCSVRVLSIRSLFSWCYPRKQPFGIPCYAQAKRHREAHMRRVGPLHPPRASAILSWVELTGLARRRP
jgi:hypothetical protein